MSKIFNSRCSYNNSIAIEHNFKTKGLTQMRSINKKAQMEASLAKLKKEIVLLEKSETYKKEQALIKGVTRLLAKHGKTKSDLILFLNDEAKNPKKKRIIKTKSDRKQRKLKVYKNPVTEEIIETRGGNHRVLKAWRAEYPTKNIEAWVIEER